MIKSPLIVDDEVEILETLRQHFALVGVQISTASSGEEALALHRKSLFPVVVTDVRMAHMNGLELIRELKKVSPTCIIYVMTGYASLSSMTDFIEAGAIDYFIKPFERLDDLVSTVQDGIRRYERWVTDLKGLKRSA